MSAHRYYAIAIALTICLTAGCATDKQKNLAPRKISIKVEYGAANINIYGEALVDWYYKGNNAAERKKYAKRPAVFRGDTTCDEDFLLAAGNEFIYTLRPGEVIFITALSANGLNAIVHFNGMGIDKEYIVDGLDAYGVKTSFRNY